MSRSFAGEKTPAKASFLLTLKEDQQGRKNTPPTGFVTVPTLNSGIVAPYLLGTGLKLCNTLGLFPYDCTVSVINAFATGGGNNISEEKSAIGLDNDADLNLQNFKLYPNPNHGTMTIEYVLNDNDKAEISIFDFTGRLRKQYPINAKNTAFTINENELKVGTYYYTITVNDRIVKTNKLIIIK